jgi:hypothetical protein
VYTSYAYENEETIDRKSAPKQPAAPVLLPNIQSPIRLRRLHTYGTLAVWWPFWISDSPATEVAPPYSVWSWSRSNNRSAIFLQLNESQKVENEVACPPYIISVHWKFVCVMFEHIVRIWKETVNEKMPRGKEQPFTSACARVTDRYPGRSVLRY